jgi:hypothetical protein
MQVNQQLGADNCGLYLVDKLKKELWNVPNRTGEAEASLIASGEKKEDQVSRV